MQERSDSTGYGSDCKVRLVFVPVKQKLKNGVKLLFNYEKSLTPTLVKMSEILIFIIFLLILNGCNTTDSMNKEEILEETNLNPIILFCPKDNCEKNLIVFINLSKKSIHCAFYDLKLEDVINILASKSKDVDVKIVMEKNNYKNQITGPGIKLDDNKYYMHNKFCIVDDNVVWTGSANPTERGAFKNNNNVVVFYSKYLAENYEEEFNELWNKNLTVAKVKHPIIYLNNKKIENYFCPEDCFTQLSSTHAKGGALYKIIDLIQNAEHSVYFMTFSFTHEDIADALLFNKNNIDIKGVFEKVQAGSKYSQYKRLKDFGLDVKLDSNSANMHHKVFIIDNETVITGSANPTESGMIRNDENILIIHDKGIAEKYLKEFERVWALE